jgi:hypothetical protein
MKSSHVWTKAEADAVYKTTAGEVSVTKPGADGTQVAPTWDDKCKKADGSTVNTQAGSTTANQLNFASGEGTVDAETGEATVSWDGTATVVYYGGMTYWTLTDPTLTIGADGSGTLTATGGGYGADMFDTSKWVQLPSTPITLATFEDASVSEDGKISVTPDYAGVEVDTDGGMSPQNRTAANWGSFPQDFVDFQILTGQSSYWYSSGGMADAKKPAAPFVVSYTAEDDGGSTPPPAADEDEVIVDVEVPEADEPGEPGGPGDPGTLDLKVAGGTATLGTATANASGFSATGKLPTVTVTDTREGAKAFTVSGQASAFSGSAGTFSGNALGWAPKLGANGVEAVAGAAVEANNPGLGASKTLVSATNGHALGSVEVGADLTLQAPETAKAGSYTSKVTLSVIG